MQWTSRHTATAAVTTMALSPLLGHNSTTDPVYSYQTTLNGSLEDVSVDSNIAEHVVVWALIDGFLFLAIVSGNVLTVAAILMNRSISHIVSNHFILSLACSDLFVGLMLPYHMMFYIEPTLGERFAFCIARLALVSLACTASVMNIIGIAIDRFLAIVYPLHYNKLMTKRLAKCIGVMAWTVAISISATPIFWNRWEVNSSSEKRKSSGKCELGYVVVPLYVKTIYLPSVVLLFSIMFAFYVKIFAETRKHAKRMRQCKNDPPDTWKSLQVLMLVMGSFTVSYMPFTVVFILNSIFQYNTSTMSVLYKVTISLAMANSAVNPLIYAWKSQGFKRAFWKILNCNAVEGNSVEPGTGFRLRRNAKNSRTVMPENKTTTTAAATTNNVHKQV